VPKAYNGKCSTDHGTAATKATHTADHKAPSQDQDQDRDLFGDDDGDMYAGIDAGDVKDEEYNLAGPIDQVSRPRCILLDLRTITACGNNVPSFDMTFTCHRERMTPMACSNTASRHLTGG
jgi:hypothetical protein